MLACFRFMVRQDMKSAKGSNKVKHPALESVRTAVGDEDCLVLWGLEESDTQICCENLANHLINKENGLAKIFNCQDMPRSQDDLYPTVCKALNVGSFSEFIECMPSAAAVWLIFDSVNVVYPHACAFFEDLIRRAKKSSKFKILLVVHTVECACHFLRGRAAIVHPLDCCIWQEQHIRDSFAHTSEDIIQNAICAGCPRVYRRRSEAELVASRWQLGMILLQRFLTTKPPVGHFLDFP